MTSLCYYRYSMKMTFKILPNSVDKSVTLLPQLPFFSLIWLHGLGDSSAGFLDYFQIRQSPLFEGARVKCLQAPMRSVTINGGAYYNSWYDIKNLAKLGSDDERYNITQIKESLEIIDKNVEEEIFFWKEKGINASQSQICKRIFIGGFSQGCAMSLCYGLTSDRVLGGIVGYSGNLFESFNLKNKGSIPILAYHGAYDDVLPYKWSKGLYDRYLKDSANFDFRRIDNLGHSVTEEQLGETTSWLLKQLKNYGIEA